MLTSIFMSQEMGKTPLLRFSTGKASFPPALQERCFFRQQFGAAFKKCGRHIFFLSLRVFS